MSASAPLAFYTAACAGSPTAPTVYQYPEGMLELVPGAATTRVRLSPRAPGIVIHGLTELDTSLPAPLIHRIAACYGFTETCNVIARHEDPNQLERKLNRQLTSYFPNTTMSGRVILDVGCGSGESTYAMARLLPGCQIIGIDHDAERLALAEAMPSARNASFRLSPSSVALPAGLPHCDLVLMSAAFQHMLPLERKVLLPLLWKLLLPGGALLFTGTPHSWLPWEPELTGLLFLNYLPDRAAAFLGRHFSSKNEAANRDRDWPELLRAGIRGGSEREILNLLPASAEVLQPAHSASRADHWRESACGTGPSPARWLATRLFRWTERRWGVVPSPYLELVIRKHG